MRFVPYSIYAFKKLGYNYKFVKQSCFIEQAPELFVTRLYIKLADFCGYSFKQTVK